MFFAPVEVRTLKVAAGECGSDAHTLMREVTEVLVRHSETLRLEVLESRNSSEAISAINSRTVDLVTIESNTPPHNSINLVADLFPDFFLLIARKPSKNPPFPQVIRAIENVRGRRIAIPEAATVGNLSFWSAIVHNKLPPKSFRTFAWPREKAFEGVITGQVDALFLLSSLRDPFLLGLVEEAGIRGTGLRLVPIAQAEAMALKRPYLEPEKIVKGAFDGQVPLPREDVITAILQRFL